MKLFGRELPVASVARATMRDAMGLIGAVLLVRGAWLIYRPAAWLLAGLMLLAVSVLLARGER